MLTCAVLSTTATHVRGQSQVAGVPPSAILKIVPVPAKVGSYPPGTYIVNNELIATSGGFRAWFELKVSNWDPNGDNSPRLVAYQIKIDCSGYADSDAPGDQPDLAPALVFCGANNAVCVAAFGESWAKCLSGTCMAGYHDKSGVNRPADNWCAPCDQASVNLIGCNYEF